MSIPLNLTSKEAAVLDAMCKHGCQKTVARLLGISQEMVSYHLRQARIAACEKKTIPMLLRWNELRNHAPMRRVSLADAPPLWALMQGRTHG